MLRYSVLLLPLLIASPDSTLAQSEECYPDWGAAAEIVRARKLMTVGELTRSAQGLPGQIVKTTLCKSGDDYVYKLVVRDDKGQLKTIVLDATRGAANVGR